jgi:hypothetical protein
MSRRISPHLTTNQGVVGSNPAGRAIFQVLRASIAVPFVLFDSSPVLLKPAPGGSWAGKRRLFRLPAIPQIAASSSSGFIQRRPPRAWPSPACADRWPASSWSQYARAGPGHAPVSRRRSRTSSAGRCAVKHSLTFVSFSTRSLKRCCPWDSPVSSSMYPFPSRERGGARLRGRGARPLTSFTIE